MDELTSRIVKRLREEPDSLSRNRHFATFEEPAARRARTIVRFLASLERDLLGPASAGPISIQKFEENQRVVLQLEFPLLHGTRTSFLSEQEFELLLHNPKFRRACEQRVQDRTSKEIA